jgi:integrase
MGCPCSGYCLQPKGHGNLGRMASPVASGQQDVDGYLRSWLGHARTRVRATTYRGYESLLRNHVVPHIGSIPLPELEPLRLQALYAQLLTAPRPLATGTVLNLHLVLTQAFGQAVRWGLLERNPASGAQPPRPRRAELTVIDETLATRLLATTYGTAYELPAAIAIATGMRRGEILALRWCDTDPSLSVAHVRRSLQSTLDGPVFEKPKTKRSQRAVVLGAFLRPYLLRQHDDQARRRVALADAWHEHDLVIDSGDGSPINPDTLSSGWTRFIRTVGLPHVRFHDLRHAHATLMLSKGVHPKIVSERLGHASIGITLDTYSHVLPSMQEEAARAFDELFDAVEPDPRP